MATKLQFDKVIVEIEPISGVVVNEKTQAITHVSGSGGGVTYKGTGGSSVSVSSTTSFQKEFYIKRGDGRESRFAANQELPIANGHSLTAIKIAFTEDTTWGRAKAVNGAHPKYVCLINHTTDDRIMLDENDNKVIQEAPIYKQLNGLVLEHCLGGATKSLFYDLARLGGIIGILVGILIAITGLFAGKGIFNSMGSLLFGGIVIAGSWAILRPAQKKRNAIIQEMMKKYSPGQTLLSSLDECVQAEKQQFAAEGTLGGRDLLEPT